MLLYDDHGVLQGTQLGYEFVEYLGTGINVSRAAYLMTQECIPFESPVKVLCCRWPSNTVAWLCHSLASGTSNRQICAE